MKEQPPLKRPSLAMRLTFLLVGTCVVLPVAVNPKAFVTPPGWIGIVVGIALTRICVLYRVGDRRILILLSLIMLTLASPRYWVPQTDFMTGLAIGFAGFLFAALWRGRGIAR